MKKEDARQIAREVVSELRQQGFLTGDVNAAYSRTGDILKRYFADKASLDDETRAKVAEAIRSVRPDAYYEVIIMYYGDGVTLERLAEYYDRDVRTIARAKRRLVIEIARAMTKEWQIP